METQSFALPKAAPSTTGSPEVPRTAREMERMEREVGRLEQTVVDAERRLQAVLSPEGPTGISSGAGMSDPAGPSSPLVGAMSNLSDRVMIANAQLSRLFDRLEC